VEKLGGCWLRVEQTGVERKTANLEWNKQMEERGQLTQRGSRTQQLIPTYSSLKKSMHVPTKPLHRFPTPFFLKLDQVTIKSDHKEQLSTDISTKSAQSHNKTVLIKQDKSSAALINL
jgi:hypothetical protein